MGARLATDVHVQRDGEPVLLPAGSKLPDWAKELVTNPKALTNGAPAEDAGDGASSDAPLEPPRTGTGSGDKAWVAYGEAIGLDVSTGKKADIIAALDARNSETSESKVKAYADMEDDQLAALAKERELPEGLARAELIEALEFDDLEREEADGDNNTEE